MKSLIPKKLTVGTLVLMLAASMPVAAFASNIDAAGGIGAAMVNLDVVAPQASNVTSTELFQRCM